MTKLSIVVMTILLSTSAFAHHGGSHFKNVQLSTASHDWEIDVQCRKEIDPNTRVKVKSHPKQIRLDGRITIQQNKKKQECRVRQLVVKLN